jgi:hypothetical protein
VERFGCIPVSTVSACTLEVWAAKMFRDRRLDVIVHFTVEGWMAKL